MTIGNGGATQVPKSLMPGVIIMPQDQHYFVKEQAFTQSQRYSFGAAEVKWFLIDPTAYVPGPTQEFASIISEVPSFFAASGPIEIDFYTNPDLGTSVATPLVLPPFNRVSTSLIAPQLILSSLNLAPSVSLGTKFSEILIPANATGAGQHTGFSVAEALPFKLDLGNKILMTAKNLDGAATLVGIRWTWFEI